MVCCDSKMSSAAAFSKNDRCVPAAPIAVSVLRLNGSNGSGNAQLQMLSYNYCRAE